MEIASRAPDSVSAPAKSYHAATASRVRAPSLSGGKLGLAGGSSSVIAVQAGTATHLSQRNRTRGPAKLRALSYCGKYVTNCRSSHAAIER